MKNAEKKGLSLVEAEMEKLMHQEEQELLSAWEGWHTQSCVPRQDVKRWSTSVDTRCTGEFAKEAKCAREMGCEGIQDTRQTRAACVDTVIGGSESHAF